MNSFSVNRFGQLLGWLISMNRVRLLGFTAGIMFSTFLIQLMLFVFGSSEKVIDYLWSCVDFGSFFIPFLILFLLSMTYTSFTSVGNSQQRGTFLMIPATNLEKFLSLIVYMTVICGLCTIVGYILGDEGSGAVMGKRFLHDLYCGLLSEDLKAEFEKKTKLTLPEIINRVYRQPLANRFLASLTEFIHDHLSDSAVEDLVRQSFIDFIRIYIAPYEHQYLPLSFVGSIAHYFTDQLSEAVESEEYTLGTILRNPIEGLVEYHSV